MFVLLYAGHGRATWLLPASENLKVCSGGRAQPAASQCLTWRQAPVGFSSSWSFEMSYDTNGRQAQTTVPGRRADPADVRQLETDEILSSNHQSWNRLSGPLRKVSRRTTPSDDGSRGAPCFKLK